MTDAKAWSAYWQGAGGTQCLPEAPAVADLMKRQWDELASALPENGRLLDLATGAGAVLRTIADRRPDLALTGVDYAQVPRWSDVHAILSGVDCAALPFPDHSFDAVTSQFGIEYCSQGAIAEAMRVLRPGGAARFIVHHAASAAIRHNGRRRDAMRALFDAGLFAMARRAAARLPAAPAQAEAVRRACAAYPDQRIASELPAALSQALNSPGGARRIADIERRAGAELERLDAMVAASLDAPAMARFCAALELQGASAHARALSDKAGTCIAWRVDAAKGR